MNAKHTFSKDRQSETWRTPLLTTPANTQTTLFINILTLYITKKQAQFVP